MVISMFMAVDPPALLQIVVQGTQSSSVSTEQSASPAANDDMRNFVVVVLAETENVWQDAFQPAETLAEAKSGLAAVKEDWVKAQDSFNAGNMADAIAAATTIKEKVVKAMESLGMTVPAGAKS